MMQYTYEEQQGLCPAGWHVPSSMEWFSMINYLGGYSSAGGKLKEAGTSHWYTPNTGATNESGFTALPGGMADSYGFSGLGYDGNFWCSEECMFPPGTFYSLSNFSSEISQNCGTATEEGMFSVRCVKDEEP
jgi:uncharacterized protein (TIGR02145 family)